MSLAPPISYSPSLETLQPDEEETVGKINEVFDEILETTARDYDHAVRAVHAKAHGILKGTLTVHQGLAPELAQGLFANPAKHEVLLRFSTNAGDILPDSISLPRGLAIKVLDVEGERLPDAEGKTQNFVLVNGPVFQAPTADKFLANLKLLAKTTDRLEGTKETLSTVLRGVNTALEAVGISSSKVQSLGGAPNSDPLGETYFSVTPFRYGNHVAKFQLVPVSPDLTAQTGTTIDAADRPDAIRETIRSQMRTFNGVWELRVQLCRDLDKQPLEDPTVEWKESDSPFQTVATIKVDPQDSWDAALVQSVDEEMRFSVWVGLEAHRPLGNINRARKAPYEHSAAFRARFNGCPIHEPSANIG
jgi:catalase